MPKNLLLWCGGLITVPDYAAIKAADEFKGKTTAINEMWQTDFTYFKIIGCFYDILCILRPDKGYRNGRKAEFRCDRPPQLSE